MKDIKYNAPDGATHYSKTYPVIYFKIFKDDVYIAMDGSLRLVRPDKHFIIKPL